jgi:hypothetical protein
VDEATCVIDPTQVAVATWEENLDGVIAAHDCRCKRLALLSESKSMEGVVNICINSVVRSVRSTMRIDGGSHTWSNIRDDVAALRSSQNAEGFCDASQGETQRADRVEAAEGVNSGIRPAWT